MVVKIILHCKKNIKPNIFLNRFFRLLNLKNFFYLKNFINNKNFYELDLIFKNKNNNKKYIYKNY